MQVCCYSSLHGRCQIVLGVKLSHHPCNNFAILVGTGSPNCDHVARLMLKMTRMVSLTKGHLMSDIEDHLPTEESFLRSPRAVWSLKFAIIMILRGNCWEHFRVVLSYAVVIICVWPHTTFSPMRTWLITITSREQEWTSWCVSGKSFSSEKAPDHCPSWPSWLSWHDPRADKLRYQPRLLIILL